MSKQNDTQTIFIAGASGVVGSVIMDELIAQKHRIHALSNALPAFSRALSRLDDTHGAECVNRLLTWYTRVDLRSCNHMESLRNELRMRGAVPLDTVIICFGPWPQHGLFEELGESFVSAPESYWQTVEELYIHRMTHLFGSLCEVLRDDGKIIFITSSFANLTHEECPPWLTARHYENLKKRVDGIIKSYKDGVNFLERNFCVHRIGIAGQKKLHQQRLSDPDTQSGLKVLGHLKIHVKNALKATKSGVVDITFHHDGTVSESSK